MVVDVEGDATATFESPVVARTRLVPPRLRTETVDRPALVTRRLMSPARLGVVVGSAGAGKSTFLAQCHAVEPFPAWLSLEPGDNDAIALWWSMIAALRTVVGDFGESYRNRLLAGSWGAVDDVVVSMCDELARRDMPIHLFLDDLHVVDNMMCRRSVHRFVSLLPDGVRVTVASRRSAPIPLGRLRVSGDLVEIDGSDLALSATEANQLLTSFGASLDKPQLDLLIDRTEGWPAGLHLAGLAASQATDVGSFVEHFHGTDHDVADYLVGEVLESVSDDDREFLVQTSILSRLTGDLCDAVTGRPGGAARLARLEQSNAFVIPLDRDHRWYRYHHLFGELVADESLRTRPNDERLLHRRAFDWLRDHGEVTAAVPHGLAAGEINAAADLLCGHWFSMMHSGRAETLRALIETFPPEAADHQPLAIAAAGVNAMTGNMRAALRWLRAAETAAYDGVRTDGIANTQSSIAIARGTLAPDGVDAALADSRIALELEPLDSPHHGLAALLVGRALVMRGDVDESTEYLEEAERWGFTNERIYALAELSLGYLRRGDAKRALAVADTARAVMLEGGSQDLFLSATVYAATALAAVDVGDVRAARVALRAAHRPMNDVGQSMPMDALHTRLLLARSALALGETAQAREYLRDAQPVIDSISDLGVMRQQHAQLIAHVDAVQSAADGEEQEFSDREIEVLEILPTRLTMREMAEELFISRNTVKTHIRRVYRKLNATSREEAVLAARNRGLLKASDESRPSSG